MVVVVEDGKWSVVGNNLGNAMLYVYSHVLIYNKRPTLHHSTCSFTITQSI